MLPDELSHTTPSKTRIECKYILKIVVIIRLCGDRPDGNTHRRRTSKCKLLFWWSTASHHSHCYNGGDCVASHQHTLHLGAALRFALWRYISTSVKKSAVTIVSDVLAHLSIFGYCLFYWSVSREQFKEFYSNVLVKSAVKSCCSVCREMRVWFFEAAEH